MRGLGAFCSLFTLPFLLCGRFYTQCLSSAADPRRAADGHSTGAVPLEPGAGTTERCSAADPRLEPEEDLRLPEESACTFRRDVRGALRRASKAQPLKVRRRGGRRCGGGEAQACRCARCAAILLAHAPIVRCICARTAPLTSQECCAGEAGRPIGGARFGTLRPPCAQARLAPPDRNASAGPR